MDIVLKNGILLDPILKNKKQTDIAIKNGLIYSIGKINSTQEVDCSGYFLFPSLFDLHTHLREPGFETSETMETGLAAAAHGGYGTICAMPNSLPVNDSPVITKYIKYRAKEIDKCNVYPIGAISEGLSGKSLSDMYSLKDAGVIAYSDDGFPVENALLLKKAMKIAKSIDMPLFLHEEDKNLSENGVMRAGEIALRLGLTGIPSSAESSMIARDLEIVRETGARVHFCHISCARSIQLIREAKKVGLPVSCEVTPNHLALSDEDIRRYDANAKVNPPLPSKSDRELLVAALADGTIDLVATDHAPHTADMKAAAIEEAPFGISGIETALPLLYTKLVKPGIIDFYELLYRMSIAPAEIAGIEPDLIKKGKPANITVFDPAEKYAITEEFFMSKGKNSPLMGKSLEGAVKATIFKGKLSYGNL